MTRILFTTIFTLIIFTSCKKDANILSADSTIPSTDTAVLVPVSGLLSRLDYNGVKQFEVTYNSSNLPGSVRYYDTTGICYKLDAFEYSSGRRVAVDFLNPDSSWGAYQIMYYYDSLNRLNAISKYPGHPVSYSTHIYYNSDNSISWVDYWRTSFPFPASHHLFYFTINYLNDSTQEFVYRDTANNFLASITTVFDKKVNPAFACSYQEPEKDFMNNILSQSSPQADAAGYVAALHYYLQRSNTYLYNGNYPLIKIEQSPGVNPTYNTTLFYYYY